MYSSSESLLLLLPLSFDGMQSESPRAINSRMLTNLSEYSQVAVFFADLGGSHVMGKIFISQWLIHLILSRSSTLGEEGDHFETHLLLLPYYEVMDVLKIHQC